MSEPKEPRRRFLRQVMAIVPTASLGTGVAAVQAGCTERPAQAATPATDARYQPTYFTEAEYAFVNAAVDHLIPADEHGPGALAAHVPEYIDRQMETPYGHGELWYMQGPFHPDSVPELGFQYNLTPRDIYRHGVAECDRWCNQQHGKAFAALDKTTQVGILKAMQGGKIAFDAVPAKTFFSFLLINTKEGFFADPMYGGNHGMSGWKLVGFPGARGDYKDWIDQPNVKYPYGPVSIAGVASTDKKA